MRSCTFFSPGVAAIHMHRYAEGTFDTPMYFEPDLLHTNMLIRAARRLTRRRSLGGAIFNASETVFGPPGPLTLDKNRPSFAPSRAVCMFFCDLGVMAYRVRRKNLQKGTRNGPGLADWFNFKEFEREIVPLNKTSPPVRALAGAYFPLGKLHFCDFGPDLLHTGMLIGAGRPLAPLLSPGGAYSLGSWTPPLSQQGPLAGLLRLPSRVFGQRWGFKLFHLLHLAHLPCTTGRIEDI